MAFTMRPSPVLPESLPEDDVKDLAVEGVPAFFGLGPSIVCVLNGSQINSLRVVRKHFLARSLTFLNKGKAEGKTEKKWLAMDLRPEKFTNLIRLRRRQKPPH